MLVYEYTFNLEFFVFVFFLVTHGYLHWIITYEFSIMSFFYLLSRYLYKFPDVFLLKGTDLILEDALFDIIFWTF